MRGLCTALAASLCVLTSQPSSGSPRAHQSAVLRVSAYIEPSITVEWEFDPATGAARARWATNAPSESLSPTFTVAHDGRRELVAVSTPGLWVDLAPRTLVAARTRRHSR